MCPAATAAGAAQPVRAQERLKTSHEPKKPHQSPTEHLTPVYPKPEISVPEQIKQQTQHLSTDPDNKSFALQSWVQASISRLAEAGYGVRRTAANSKVC